MNRAACSSGVSALIGGFGEKSAAASGSGAPGLPRPAGGWEAGESVAADGVAADGVAADGVAADGVAERRRGRGRRGTLLLREDGQAPDPEENPCGYERQSSWTGAGGHLKVPCARSGPGDVNDCSIGFTLSERPCQRLICWRKRGSLAVAGEICMMRRRHGAGEGPRV